MYDEGSAVRISLNYNSSCYPRCQFHQLSGLEGNVSSQLLHKKYLDFVMEVSNPVADKYMHSMMLHTNIPHYLSHTHTLVIN